MDLFIMLLSFILSLNANCKNVLFSFGSFHLEHFHSLYKINMSFKFFLLKKITRKSDNRSKNICLFF